jgi:hypothetical protein
MPTIAEREIRAKELAALAAVVEACSKAITATEFLTQTRDKFMNTAKDARSMIDDVLKDMYTRG